MPRRVYICDNCGHTFELYQPLHEDLKKKCPKCNKNKLYQDLTGQYVSVKSYTTVGSMAESNSNKMGQNKIQELEAKAKEKNELMIKEKRERLEKAGFKTLSPSTSNLPKLSDENYKKIIKSDGSIDKVKAEKYIKSGKV